MSNSILCSSAAGGKENSMYFDATEFATRLSTLRKAQGMTQEEMAEALNISLEHLSKMERGKRKPSMTREEFYRANLQVCSKLKTKRT